MNLPFFRKQAHDKELQRRIDLAASMAGKYVHRRLSFKETVWHVILDLLQHEKRHGYIFPQNVFTLNVGGTLKIDVLISDEPVEREGDNNTHNIVGYTNDDGRWTVEFFHRIKDDEREKRVTMEVLRIVMLRKYRRILDPHDDEYELAECIQQFNAAYAAVGGREALDALKHSNERTSQPDTESYKFGDYQ